MAEPTIQLGGGNWAGKTDNLLGYYKEGERFYKQDFTFSRSTTGTYTDSDGYIQTSAINMPRVDYLNNSNGSLILEPQRTNLVTHSEDFSNASWVKKDVTIALNDIISPDGTTNAAKITETATTERHDIGHISTVTSSTIASASGFFKIGSSGRYLNFNVISDGTVNQYISTIINLENGIVTQQTIGSDATFISSSVKDYGNGWYKVCVIFSIAGRSNYFLKAGLSNSATPPISSYGNVIYLGNGTSYMYAWGFQLEQGSYPTTLINTSGSTVTRNADTCSISNVADRIGQTEGTLFLDIDFINIGAVKVLLSIHDGASNKRLEIWSNGLEVNGFIGGSVNIAIGNTTISEGRHKLALAYNQSGDQAFYVDGVQIGTSNTVYTIAALTELSYGIFSGSSVYAANGNINNTKIYNTRLSNSELATLTTL